MKPDPGRLDAFATEFTRYSFLNFAQNLDDDRVE